MPIRLTSWETHTDVFDPNKQRKTLQIQNFILKLYQKDKITTHIEITISGHVLLNHKEQIPDEDIAKLTAYNLFKKYLKGIERTVNHIDFHFKDTSKISITPPLQIEIQTLSYCPIYHITLYLIDINDERIEMTSFQSKDYNSFNTYLQIVRTIKNYVKTIQNTFKQTIIAVLTKPAVQQPKNT